MNDSCKPLRSKVLAVPQYREQNLANVRMIADKSLDWNSIGPFVDSQANLIDSAIKAETRKLDMYEAFAAAVRTKRENNDTDKPAGFRGGPGSMNLKTFVDGHRAFQS